MSDSGKLRLMKVTIVQPNIKWEDKEYNLSRLASTLDYADPGPGLVVLPEMFTTGFTMNPGTVAEDMEGETISWMKKRTSLEGYALSGSLIITENREFYNRMLFVKPDGTVNHYDKHHLHSMSGEDTVYKRGEEQVIIPYCKFNFNLQICYDLRFPVWSRNRGQTDVIIYSANWPAVRSNIWKSLLVARAIENQCYVIGVNRVGENPDGTAYSGDSMIIGPKGEILASIDSGREGVASALLSRETIDKYRSDMPVWRDADNFTLTF